MGGEVWNAPAWARVGEKGENVWQSEAWNAPAGATRKWRRQGKEGGEREEGVQGTYSAG